MVTYVSGVLVKQYDIMRLYQPEHFSRRLVRKSSQIDATV